MAKKKVTVVFEDDSLIVCEKPAGMPVQSDNSRDLDVQTCLPRLGIRAQPLNDVCFGLWYDLDVGHYNRQQQDDNAY